MSKDKTVGGCFRTTQKLGSGSFGEVYAGILLVTLLGICMRTNVDVAIKFVNMKFIK